MGLVNMHVYPEDKVIIANQIGKELIHTNGKEWVVQEVGQKTIKACPVGSTKAEVFHKSRILVRNGKKTDAMAKANKMSNIGTRHKPTEAVKMTKQGAKMPNNKKQKEEPKQLTLADLTKDGSIIMTKMDLKFDHDDIKVTTHILIDKDKKHYHCFQLYNGSLGRRSGLSIPKKRYAIKDYEKFLKDKNKKGYR